MSGWMAWLDGLCSLVLDGAGESVFSNILESLESLYASHCVAFWGWKCLTGRFIVAVSSLGPLVLGDWGAALLEAIPNS